QHGNTSSFTITPDTGYSISGVTGCGGALTGNSYQTAGVTGDCTVQASFAVNNYPVVFDLAGGARTGGGALNQSIAYNTAATAPTFTPPTGKTFSGWSTTFTAITGPLTVTALYGDVTHSVTPVAGTGGAISPASVQSIIHGQTTTFNLSPDIGYSLASVSGTCGGNLSGSIHTTNSVLGDCTVQANFSLNNYAVVFDLDGGTRTGGGALNQTVAHGAAAVAPSFTPPSGQTFSGWSTSFTSVTGPLTITALYGTNLHVVTPSANPGGSIGPATPVNVTHGGSTSFLITPATGFTLTSVGGSCGGNLVGTTYTTNVVLADCSVIANFTGISYTVSFDLDGGTRTGGGALSQTVSHGDPAIAPTLTPPIGKFFSGWSTDFSSITGPVTVTAIYASTAYTATPSAGQGGSISPATPQTLGEGGTATFVINPDTGYVVDDIQGSCQGQLSGESFTTNPLLGDCTLVVIFAPARYTVTFELGGGSRSGGGELNQEIQHGGSATAPGLMPPAGKTFSHWSTAFTEVTGPLTVTAIYSDRTYTVTAIVGSGGSVTPAAAQTVAYSASASFHLLPAPDYIFAGATGDCAGNKTGEIYTTAPILADCVINFAFDPILKGVDEQGNTFTGEVLRPGSSRSFSLKGGSGKWTLSATLKRAGETSSPVNETPIGFLTKSGADLASSDGTNYKFTARRSGRYLLTFTDDNGQSLTIEFIVYPNLGFTSTYQESSSGKLTQVKVLLDDDPIDYPVIAPFTVEGGSLADSSLTESLAAQGEFTITSGRLALLELVPKASSGEISFILASKGLGNAVLGDIARHKVTLKELATIPLNLTLIAQQAGQTKTLMVNTAGIVTLAASLTGNYSYDWSGSAPELGIGNATGAQPAFNPSGLNGPYLVKVTVRELASPNRSQTSELLLRIVASEPAAYTNFYSIEYEISPNRLPICTEGGMARVEACHDIPKAIYMETLSTYEIKLGRSSDFASWRDQQFGLATEIADIRDADGKAAAANQKDPEYEHLGYEVDFEISGLEQAGQTVPVVIPLKPGLVIPGGAVWRKYSATGWRNFVENPQNQIHSAKRALNGECPPPSTEGWTPGLITGNDCVRLIIQDGGPNDLDARADGVIRDPSALAVKPEVVQVTTVGKGRGGSLDIIFLSLLMLGSLLFYTRNIIASNNKQ
ncbi:MAG: InlB B-repeat-containing protein, partial [Cellvibrio sp.]